MRGPCDWRDGEGHPIDPDVAGEGRLTEPAIAGEGRSTERGGGRDARVAEVDIGEHRAGEVQPQLGPADRRLTAEMFGDDAAQGSPDLSFTSPARIGPGDDVLPVAGGPCLLRGRRGGFDLTAIPRPRQTKVGAQDVTHGRRWSLPLIGQVGHRVDPSQPDRGLWIPELLGRTAVPGPATSIVALQMLLSAIGDNERDRAAKSGGNG